MDEPSLKEGGTWMDKRLLMGVGAGVLVGLVGAGTLYGFNNVSSVKEPSKLTSVFSSSTYNKTKVKALSDVIGAAYIGESDADDMTEGIYKGFVYGLGDGYTVYLSEDAFSKEQTEAKGNYLGTGIKFTWGITNQHLIVTDVIPNSPAEKAGIVVGDKIFEIDGIKAMGSNDTKIYEKLVYTGSEPVHYLIKNNEETKTKEVELVADVVEINLVDTQLLDNHIGYIELSGLVEDTPDEIQQAIDKLISEGAQKLILDLRGVYSDNCVAVQKLSDLFIDQNEVFSVKNKDNAVTSYTAEKGAYDMPLAVITNNYTEGVIEAFPAAIKAFNKGIIVGEKTAGNGTTNIRVPLEDGSGLSITTGIVLDAQGNEIKDQGVAPDVVQKTITENTLELVTTGVLTLENDVVLQKAIEALK